MMKQSFFKSWKLFLAGAILVGLAVALLLMMKNTKSSVDATSQRAVVEDAGAGPHVRVTTVNRGADERTITLIGEAHPFAEVILYAKISGYVKRILVDKGDRVKEGDLLATIESPEVDSAVPAARANARNLRDVAKREKQLLAKNLISQQEADQAVANADVAESQLNVLRMQTSFETIRAPFTGTITARFVDDGSLVQNAMSSQTQTLPIATISQTNRLRIYVYLDQHDAVVVHPGDSVNISSSDRPGFLKRGVVERISGELDAKTRMLLTEIDIDNSANEILPGSFVQVSMHLKETSLPDIPAEALVMRGDNAYAAIITAENTIHFSPITVADNDGRVVRIVKGLQAGERVALYVGASLMEGAKVQPALDSPAGG